MMDDNNRGEYARQKAKFSDIGIILHHNPLWNSLGACTPEATAIMKDIPPDIDCGLRTREVEPFWRPSYFPVLSYEMDLNGHVHAGSSASRGVVLRRSPARLRPEKIACPHRSCVCIDKYSFLEGVERNISPSPLADHAKTLRERV